MKEKKTKKLVLNVSAGCSPFVELIWNEDTDLNENDVNRIVKNIEDNINNAFHCGGANVEYTNEKLKVTVHPLTDMKAKTETARKKEQKKRLEEVLKKGPALKIVTPEYIIKNNPDKDKSGWWVVNGIRHACVVKAENAKNAVDVAFESGNVGEWEFISVDFLGEDPKIIGL